MEIAREGRGGRRRKDGGGGRMEEEKLEVGRGKEAEKEEVGK